MALLDIQGFVTPEQKYTGLDTLATTIKGLNKPTVSKAAMSSIYSVLNPDKFKNPNVALDAAQIKEKSNFLNNSTKDIYEYLQSGGSDAVALNMAITSASQLKENVNNIDKLNLGWNEIEKSAKDKSNSGIDLDATKQNFYKKFLYNDDGTPKKISDIASQGNVIDQLGGTITYNTEGFKTALKEANPNKQEQEFTKVNKDGTSTTIKSSLQVPSAIYRFEETPEGDKPVVVSEDVTMSDNTTSSLMHELLGDNQTGNVIKTIPQANLNAYSKNYKGIQGYIQQEKDKFAKEAEKRGIQTKDPSGEYTLEFQKTMDDYGRAVAYQKFDEYGTALGGFSTKGGLPGKENVVKEDKSKKGGGINISLGKQSDIVADESLVRYLNKATADADGFKDIKNKVGKFTNPLGLNYGLYKEIKLGYKDGEWKVKLKDASGKEELKSMDDFYSDVGQESDTKKQVIASINKYIKAHPKGQSVL
jgi:hypothetical protein